VPQALLAASADEGGRGLAIVNQLADQWGVELRQNGKCLWFQLEDP
jgi:anti-sigma regulatory factor (Ser/Thr protein kinase)